MSRQKMDGLTQKAIKEHHLKEIYLHVLKSGGLSRAQLRREMNLSFPSVSALVDELINCGILEEGELIETTERGRPSTRLQLKQNLAAIPFAAILMVYLFRRFVPSPIIPRIPAVPNSAYL